MPNPTGSNAIDILTMQHDEVDELFEQLEAATDRDVKQQLFDQLADQLAAHSKIEETVFYPAVMAEETEDLLLQAAEEHLSVKRLLADLLITDIEDKAFDAKLSVMREQVEHHARDEEEGKLFPKLRELLDADTLDGLGGELVNTYEELIDSRPRQQVPTETEHAAWLR